MLDFRWKPSSFPISYHWLQQSFKNSRITILQLHWVIVISRGILNLRFLLMANDIFLLVQFSPWGYLLTQWERTVNRLLNNHLHLGFIKTHCILIRWFIVHIFEVVLIFSIVYWIICHNLTTVLMSKVPLEYIFDKINKHLVCSFWIIIITNDVRWLIRCCFRLQYII